MRVPLSWLREYVDLDLPPRRLAEELTLRGMEAEVETTGADVRAWFDGVLSTPRFLREARDARLVVV